ncbi:hypothetical protein NDJ15_16340 [Vibrio parahaemolyticus]|uniref:hypothetical protein n=1 Tax=Vibrio parahaemolyticus TaxID=670 RepID=UPI002160809F|nr:hypothetical protein [Vibrio parahaemolyticus]EJG1508045.1 hypothetical protein [Vibrio parahaemolyticus]MCS0069393.1 hypothetical protein [Vibrio parahaemolyticus]MCS0262096.1 hypothetical protein [Vibrio parahaemolyticus]
MFTAQWFRLGGGVVHPLMRRYKYNQIWVLMFSDFKYLINVERLKNWNLRANVEYEKEPVVSFISSWISLNHLYATHANVLKDEFIQWAKQESEQTGKGPRRGDKAELEFFATSTQTCELLSSLKSEKKSYEVTLPIRGVLYGNSVPDETERTINILDLESVELFLVVYQVRNNLFHGSKDPLKSKRDETLCKTLAQFLLDFHNLVEKKYL